MKKILFFLLLPFTLFSQIQIGNPINGEASGNFFGENIALSADGSTVVAASTYNNSYRGRVRVFRNTENQWLQIGQNIDGQVSDFLGDNVAISSNGNTIAASCTDNIGINAGKVRIYKYISDLWVLDGEISGELPGDSAGIISMSADGNTIAIGAPYNDGVQDAAGHVRVYIKSNGSWIQLGQDIDGEFQNDNFGSTISLSADGSTLAVGAPYHSQVFYYGGYVKVYKYLGNSWQQVGQNIYGQQVYDLLGSSVSLSSDGSFLAVGAPYNSTNGTYSGKVRVFTNILNVWQQQGPEINGLAANEFSGTSISLSSDGSSIAIGIPNTNGNPADSGKCKVFKLINDNWFPFGATINGQSASDYFGGSVSLSANGLILAIGAYRDDAIGQNSGQVRIYDLSSILSSSTFFIEENFSLFPNPASDNLTIQVDYFSTHNEIVIHDISGKTMYSQHLKSNRTTLDISSYAKGVYFLTLISENKKTTQKFIVK